MDLYCPNCGEPWDNDSLHEEVTARREAGQFDVVYANVAAGFRQNGCKALETAFGPQECQPANAHAAMSSLYADALYDLLGDDMDGAAAMMEDYPDLFG